MPKGLERATALGAGKAQAVKARLRGLSGVFTTLAEQHAEIKALLEHILKTDDSVKQSELWRTVRKELLSHESAEASEVYPTVATVQDDHDAARRHEIAAEGLESAVERVQAEPFGSQSFRENLEALLESVTQHTEEEENDYFPRVLGAIGKEQAEDLTQRFMTFKEERMLALSELDEKAP
jgi:hemerythrin superfamily protein